MYHVSDQDVDERTINVHYCCYYCLDGNKGTCRIQASFQVTDETERGPEDTN